MIDDTLTLLRLLQLADSALPIGATAHSFGLETLTSEGALTVDRLAEFLSGFLEEAGAQEGIFCRAAHRLSRDDGSADVRNARWIALNRRLSALKPAREGRAASATLGRRLLQLVMDLDPDRWLMQAIELSRRHSAEIHHSTAFGLMSGALDVDEETAVLAYLQQTLAGTISACQRLLPLGQVGAGRLLWELKPAIIAAAALGRSGDPDQIGCFVPLMDLGGMRHPGLTTRLFIS